jgi:PAS domain S-box-containing protein
MDFSTRSSTDPSAPVSRLLDLSTTYYLRKLLRQHLHHLKSIVAFGASIPADDLSDLAAVLTSLYLEPEELASTVDQLDRLVAAHEAMSAQPAQFQTELVQLEEKIFWLLGYKSCAIGRQGNIVLVEPDRTASKRVYEALMEKGYEVTIASTADQVLNQLRLNLPDVILVAVKLVEMSGFTLCQQLKALPDVANTPVILLGEMDCIQEKVQAFESGAIDYLAKPVQIEELVLRITARRQLQDLQTRLAEQNQALQIEVKERAAMEERHRNIFDNAVIGMFQSTLAGRYLRVNQAMATLYGYGSPQEMVQEVGMIDRHIYVAADRRNEFIAYMSRFNQVTAFESQVRRRDGSVIWIAESVRSVFDESGTLLFYEGSVQDITDRKRMEHLLQTQFRTTKILTMSSTVMQASPLILAAIGELLGWHRGELWLLHQSKQIMHKVDRWLAPTPYSASGIPSPPPPIIKEQGFPGLVWSHGEPLWVANLQQITQLTDDERIRYRGVQSAVGFPLIAGYRTLGVMLFFSAKSDELNESLMGMLTTLSRHFAQFIDRRYVDTALKQSEKRLQTATQELTEALAQLQSLQIKVLKSDLDAIKGDRNL